MVVLNVESRKEIKRILDNDGIIAFPTDTVYGVGCLYDSVIGLEKIKRAKGRSDSKPIPCMVANADLINTIAKVNDLEKKCIEKFLPGPLTIVLDVKSDLDKNVTNGFDTIAVRIPDHDIALKILEIANKPMLVTSANLSDTPSKLNSEDVIDDLGKFLDGIVLGKSTGKKASTIIKIFNNDVVILREGLIGKEEVKECLK